MALVTDEITEENVRVIAKTHFGMSMKTDSKLFMYTFGSFFGTKPKVVQLVYNEFVKTKVQPVGYKLKYLLWTLYFLRTNDTVLRMSSTFQVSTVTLRKWIWVTVALVANIKVINFKNRFMKNIPSNKCKISLDGTDCPIEEKQPFNKKYFSHKFHGPGVKYEIGVCITTGWICWYNGPFPCGNSDLQIARVGLIQYLLQNEKVLADGGYNDGDKYFSTPTGKHDITQRMCSLCRARHETINGRMKNFKVLSTKFRNDLDKHHDCFKAILNLVQIYIMLFDSNFEVYYNENLDVFRT